MRYHGCKHAISARTGGEDGIRTREDIATLHAFQACAIDHSATSPRQEMIYDHRFKENTKTYFVMLNLFQNLEILKYTKG